MPGEVIISDKVEQFSDIIKAIPETDEVPVADVLSRFLEEQKNDYCAWQIILFFSEHPCVRFNRLAIIHALNQTNGRRHIQVALDELSDQGVLKISNEGNMPLYSLAEGVRGLIQRLTRPAQKR